MRIWEHMGTHVAACAVATRPRGRRTARAGRGHVCARCGSHVRACARDSARALSPPAARRRRRWIEGVHALCQAHLSRHFLCGRCAEPGWCPRRLLRCCFHDGRPGAAHFRTGRLRRRSGDGTCDSAGRACDDRLSTQVRLCGDSGRGLGLPTLLLAAAWHRQRILAALPPTGGLGRLAGRRVSRRAPLQYRPVPFQAGSLLPARALYSPHP